MWVPCSVQVCGPGTLAVTSFVFEFSLRCPFVDVVQEKWPQKPENLPCMARQPEDSQIQPCSPGVVSG